MSDDLILRAKSLGITTSYPDIDGREHHADQEVIQNITETLSRSKKSDGVLDDAIVCSLEKIEFELRSETPGLRFELILEGGMQVALRPEIFKVEYDSGKNKTMVRITDALPPGEHEIVVYDLERPIARSAIFICPVECYWHPSLKEVDPFKTNPHSDSTDSGNSSERRHPGKDAWNGIWIQLYALRSDRNWGIGDFGDVMRMAAMVGRNGVKIIGLSPVHVPFFMVPEFRSPYSPSSRFFKNPMFLDIPALIEFQESEEAKDLVLDKDFLQFLRNARSEETIDYNSVFIWKFRFLEILFNDFLYKYTNFFEEPGQPITYRDRGFDFKYFLDQEGEALVRQATFDTLEERFRTPSPGDRSTGFPGWPPEFHDVNSQAVIDFKLVNQKRILFYSYLQYLADRQFDNMLSSCSNMGVSIYSDLAVGSHPSGAEVWSNPHVYVKEATVGAPPDPIAPQGQDWGLAPMNPHVLKEERYAPFIQLIRKTMPDRGLMRIDHVMTLCRLYWVVQTSAGKKGAYVRYPFEDLILILALESQRKKCMIIGEDLGTVPDFFRLALTRSAILSWKIIFFEHSGDEFTNPADYPEQSIATLNTHDLPTLLGWKDAEDIRTRESLGITPSPEAEQMKKDRMLDVARAERLAGMSSDSPGFARALYKLLLNSGSRIRLVSIYDIFGEKEQPNLPGTTDEYPCWAKRHKRGIQELTNMDLFKELFMGIIKS